MHMHVYLNLYIRMCNICAYIQPITQTNLFLGIYKQLLELFMIFEGQASIQVYACLDHYLHCVLQPS